MYFFYFLTQQNAINKRIIGGIEVDNSNKSTTSIQQWPWIVALIDEDKNLRCGASLISSEWIMTAAHCLYGSDSRVNNDLVLTAVFQQSDLDPLYPESIIREIRDVIIHPHYNYNANENDIALLRLDAPVYDLEPVRIPGMYIDTPVVPNGTRATVLGWGKTTSLTVDTLLRKVELPIVDLQECADSYSPFGININPNMLCAGFELGGYDACSGDSGGPLVVPHESGRGWKQVGIVSFGIGCALPDYFGVYTRISRYTEFIEKTICNHQTEKPDDLSILRDGNQLTITLTSTANNTQDYRIYYAPYPIPSPIQHYDLIGRNSVSTKIAEESVYYVTGQKLENNCSSEFSPIFLTE